MSIMLVKPILCLDGLSCNRDNDFTSNPLLFQVQLKSALLSFPLYRVFT